MKAHIENPQRPGVALCGEPFQVIASGLTVTFCKDCIDAQQDSPDAYREGYQDGISACITTLKAEAGHDGHFGFSPSLSDAAAHLQVLRDAGKLQP